MVVSCLLISACRTVAAGMWEPGRKRKASPLVACIHSIHASSALLSCHVIVIVKSSWIGQNLYSNENIYGPRSQQQRRTFIADPLPPAPVVPQMPYVPPMKRLNERGGLGCRCGVKICGITNFDRPLTRALP